MHAHAWYLVCREVHLCWWQSTHFESSSILMHWNKQKDTIVEGNISINTCKVILIFYPSILSTYVNWFVKTFMTPECLLTELTEMWISAESMTTQYKNTTPWKSQSKPKGTAGVAKHSDKKCYPPHMIIIMMIIFIPILLLTHQKTISQVKMI